MDLVKSYDEARQRVIELARTIEGEEAQTRIPACPDWSARDLVAHLVGIAADYSVGRIPDIPAEAAADRSPEATKKVDEWTQVHIDTRRQASVDDLAAEWEVHATQLRPMLAGERDWPEGMPFWSGMGIVADIATHEQDLRAAANAAGARDSEAMDVAFQVFSTALLMRVQRAGLPALRIVTDQGEQVVGDGEPKAVLKGDRFDVLRALSGRRTAEQVRAMFVEGEAEPYLGVISLYPMPATPVEG